MLIPDKQTIQIFKEAISKINPDLVITHAPEDYHSDHRELWRIISNSVGFSCPVLFCDTLMGINFQPDFYVEISEFFDHKKSQFYRIKANHLKNFMKQ